MINSTFVNMNDNPLRSIKGKVELYNGSTLARAFGYNNDLQEVTITRAGEKGKFFGFGVCQKLVTKVIDRTGTLSVTKGQKMRVRFSSATDSDFVRVCPVFIVNTATRDETSNVISIEAYDILDCSVKHSFSELGLVAPYTIKNVVQAISSLLGLSGVTVDTSFDISYPNGANFSGDENIREVLNAVAEVTQTIYFVDHNDKLVFKRLDVDGPAVYTIDKSTYFDLKTVTPVTLTKLVSATELGDNVEAGDDTGVVQYVRDNPFWTLRDDMGDLLDAALERISGLTICPFNMKWRGMFLLEIGDKIAFTAKDGSQVNSYILDDTLNYKGGMNETSDWEYVPESDRGTANNSTNLGEKLSQTFARVDKTNRTVTLHASLIENNTQSISELEVGTKEIVASVTGVSQRVTELDEQIENVSDQTNARIDTVSEQASLKLDKTGVELTIEEVLADGVEKVVTASKKYRFDDEGMDISSKGSNISTKVTEDGMRINRGGSEVLKASNEGVFAEDLHAKTYLIIGGTSRLEDRGNRTAVYWIGGNY